ncbi:MAG TPA: hypothetical protein VN611_07580 [Patescibacteria group bacterium]|nr:hypothetical protein [Patescibacteria group bacterium]
MASSGLLINLDDGNSPNVQNAIGSSLSDTIGGNNLNNSLAGAASGDYLWGGVSGDDTLDGGNGDDQLWGGTYGNDILWGGAGNDSYWFGKTDNADRIMSDSANGNDIIVWYNGGFADVNFSTSGSDLLMAYNGSNYLTLEGWLTSSSGSRVSKCTFGDKFIFQFDSTGFISADTTARTDKLYINLNQALTGNIQFLTTGAGSDSLAGNSLSNILSSGGGDNYLWGGPGGDDTLIGGSGADLYWYGVDEGYDLITATTGSDSVYLYKSVFTDPVYTISAGNDLVISLGGEGNLTVEDWASTASASRINQFYTSDGFLRTCSSSTTGNTAASLWTLNASAAAAAVYVDLKLPSLLDVNVLTGSNGADTLFGNSLNNSLAGGSGGDILWGGAGNDVLAGGPGSDVYWFGSGDGNDTIVASSDNTNDSVVFYNLKASDLTVQASGNNLVLTTTAGESLTVVDWYIAGDAKIKNWSTVT